MLWNHDHLDRDDMTKTSITQHTDVHQRIFDEEDHVFINCHI